MTDYTHIIPAELLLERKPADTSSALRSHEAALLYIDEDGDVRIGTRTYFGGDGLPGLEYHNRTLTFTLADSAGGACLLDMDRLHEDLADGGVLSALIDRIKAGHTVEWDGSNYKGYLTKDATAAQFEMDTKLREIGYGGGTGYASDREVWDAEVWLTSGEPGHVVLSNVGITPTASDAEVAEAVAKLKREAEANGITLCGDVEEALRKIMEREAQYQD